MSDKIEKSIRNQITYRIHNFRMNNSLTQKEIAASIDMSLSGLKKIETGQTNVSVPYLIKMHKEYGLSADYVLFGETESVDAILDSVKCLDYKDKLLLYTSLFAYLSEISDDATKVLTKEELIKLIDDALK